ncbi:MAG TPA: hypothetical protein VJS43_14515 [Candidatus Acidoferrales bacterium]|nr:hypothetical protein [Candidatus Acidoferrales bacterium]
MIGTISSVLFWAFIAGLAYMGWLELREQARKWKREQATNHRMQRNSARQRKYRGKLPKHPPMPRRPGRLNVVKVGQSSLF